MLAITSRSTCPAPVVPGCVHLPVILDHCCRLASGGDVLSWYGRLVLQTLYCSCRLCKPLVLDDSSCPVDLAQGSRRVAGCSVWFRVWLQCDECSSQPTRGACRCSLCSPMTCVWESAWSLNACRAVLAALLSCALLCCIRRPFAEAAECHAAHTALSWSFSMAVFSMCTEGLLSLMCCSLSKWGRLLPVFEVGKAITSHSDSSSGGGRQGHLRQLAVVLQS